ncbi:retrovirus-related pol polyprotein from transposon TNT 1-94 [Tanacetum coccineum]
MQDKLHQFEILDVWELVPIPYGKNIIAVKWLWKNKSDAENIVIRNKSRLVAKGYKQEEGIDFEESFAPVARLSPSRSSRRLQVHQSPRSIFISQSQYTIELLKKHGMDECVSMSTSMATESLDADLQGTPTDQTTYRRMIGGLMYLTASRPDISFATFVCARYQACPTVKHLKEVKRIFWYLRQSYNMGLWYPNDSEFELIAYSKADHARYCTAMSNAEAEYVSLFVCCAQVIWMRTQLLDYGYKYNIIPMYCWIQKEPIAFIPNLSAFREQHTKHSGTHFIKEHVEKGTVELYLSELNTNLRIYLLKPFPKNALST